MSDWKIFSRRGKCYLFCACVLAVIVCLAFMAVPFFRYEDPCDRPPDAVNREISRAIVECIKESQATVSDLNKDGLVNCIDHSINFKKTWNRLYPEWCFDCYIVRNVNRAKDMNHLFVRVIGMEPKWIYIEPWTSNPYVYQMEAVWGDRYDPDKNIYNETDYWLSKAE